MLRADCHVSSRPWLMGPNKMLYVFLVLVLCVDGAVVTVDFRTSLATNGKQVFDRHRFVNAHGDLAAPDNAEDKMEYAVLDLDVMFTRSSSEGPFSGSDSFPDNVGGLEEEGRLRRAKINCKTCDQLRKRLINRERVATDTADKLERFQGSNQGISDAAAFSADYFRSFFSAAEGYPRPRYSECFNEPMNDWKSFRRYAGESEFSVVSRIGNVCGQMCRDITATNPDMLAGGPGASSARPHVQNFGRWHTRIKNFIDSARSAGCLDFISEHIYSSGGAVQDANLDLLETYTAKTSEDGNPIQYMVTEAGAYHGSWFDKSTEESAPPVEGRDFIIMADSFKAFMSTMRVHDNVLKFVNFLTLDPGDGRNGKQYRYPWSLTEGGTDDVVEWTPLLHYLELFKGVEGDFVYSYSDDPYVKAHAVANSNRAYVLLQNLATEGQSAEVHLRFPFGVGSVMSVVERKIWLRESERTAEDIVQNIQRPGKVMWKNSTLTSVPATVQIKPEAMHVLAITFDEPVLELRKVERSRHYMAEIVDGAGHVRDYPVPVEANNIYTFQFNGIPQSPNGVGYIRIGHSRNPEDVAKPKVYVNDAEQPITDYDPTMAGPKRIYGTKYFGVFVIPYALNQLGAAPRIKVQYPDDGGWLSSVVLEVDECKGGACCLLGGGMNDNLQCGTITNTEAYPRRLAPSSEQILSDPSFEEGTGAWTLTEGAEIQRSGQTMTGDHRLRFLQEGAKAVQRLYLRENSVYRLHCYVSGSIRFSIWANSAIYGQNVGKTSQGPTEKWRNQELDFPIRNSGEYDIVLERDNQGISGLQSSGVRADECSLYASANIPPFVGSESVNYESPLEPWNPPGFLKGDNGALKNPSFEMGPEFRWTMSGPLDFTGLEALEGLRAMYIYPSISVASQTVFLKKEQKYRLRCYVSGTGSLTMEVSFRGEKVSRNSYGPVTPIDYGSWGYKDMVFVAPKIEMDVVLYNDGDSECIVDFCTMFEYSGPITDPENEQLIQNSGFEQGNEPWLFSNGAEIRTSRAFTGVSGLRLRQEGSTAVQRVYLEEGNTYRWHCYTTGNIQFLLWKDSILYGENFGNTFPVPSSEWSNQEVDVMIEESGEYELTIVRDNGGVPSRQMKGVWVDDCSLYAATDGFPPYVGSRAYNLPDLAPWKPPAALLGNNGEIKNPSFEELNDFRWTVRGPLEFTRINALYGLRSMFIYPSTTVAEQTVYLNGGKRYRLRCYVSGPGSLSMEVSFKNNRVSKNSFGEVKPIAREGWGYKDLVFDSEGISHTVSLYNVGEHECIVDFCTLFQFSGVLTDPEPEQVLGNPSFEQAPGSWTLTDGAQIQTDQSFSGNRAITFTREGSKATQRVFLRSDTLYRLHCYVKGSIRMSVWSQSTMFAQNLGDVFDEQVSNWKNQEVDFEVGDSGEYSVILERDNQGSPDLQSSGVWVDECSIFPATNGVPPYAGSESYRQPENPSRWVPPPRLQGTDGKIKNPSFELQKDFRWVVSGELKFTSVEPLHGSRSMFVYPMSTVARQTLYLTRDQRYRVRCYVRGPGMLTMEIRFKGNRLSKNSVGPVQAIARGDWGYTNLVFDALGITHELEIYNEGDIEVIVDFCTLFTFSGALTDPELS